MLTTLTNILGTVGSYLLVAVAAISLITVLGGIIAVAF